ncbi:MAG: winged helix-turn-helix domain-containing protein [Anaerolineae bacterium]
MSRPISITNARRLNIHKQRLTGLPPASMLDTVRALGCLQLDPISAVQKNHLLVLWSRLGAYDLAEVDRLMWEDRALFEYWAHVASIVLTEDYPIHAHRMRSYPGERAFGVRLNTWVAERDDLRQHILERLRTEGMLASRDFEHEAASWGASSGWTSGRDVNRVLDYLWQRGEVVVAGRRSNTRYWGLAEHFFPAWTPRDVLEPDEVVYRAAQRAIQALGVATPQHINLHYIRHRYPNLPDVLKRLVADGRIQPVRILTPEQEALRGTWYIHTEDIPLLEDIERGAWTPTTTLLSPFDNLIADRDRTHRLFDYFFRVEIYVPEAKRQYGYYVLSILHGDRLIGRIDPKMDRRRGVLTINAVYREPGAPDDPATGAAVRDAIQRLAHFLGAKAIEYTGEVGWPGLKA